MASFEWTGHGPDAPPLQKGKEHCLWHPQRIKGCVAHRLRTLAARIHPIGWLPWIALLATIIGARLWLVSLFATGLPIHDQWDAEAAFLFKPWLEGHLTWTDLFRLHNEHRIMPSRLLALGLLRLNGQWDAQLQMAVNAILCGIIGIAVTAAAWRFFSRQSIPCLAAAISLWLALPYAQENTLWGFQSCFYFTLIFSLIAIWGLSFHPAFSKPWWFGGMSAILACFSMASGVLAAVVVLVIAALRAVQRRTWAAEQTVTAIAAGLVLALGFFLRQEVPHHAALKAATPLVWVNVFGRSLAWPFSEYAWFAFLIYLPLAWLGVLYLKQRHGEERGQRQIELLLAIGIWVVLQAAAVAYSRGADGAGPIASRYMDILALGALANAGAIVVLVSASQLQRHLVPACYFWLVAVTAGAGFTSYKQVSSQAGRQAWLRSEEENVRAYVATGDKKFVEGNPPPRIPFPYASRLARLLNDPSIRKILPAAVRLPLSVEAKVSGPGAFVPNGYPPEVPNPEHERSWGSYSSRGSEQRGSMESNLLTPRLSYLQIELAGYLREGMTLDVRSAGGDKQVRFIPTTRLDSGWRSGFIAVPATEIKIVARDENVHEWFAFREPREVGRYSYYAEKFLTTGKALCLAGVTCLFAALLHRALNGITKRRKA